MEVFLGKLKDQSFTVLVMVGVIWYQGRLMEERIAYWQQKYEERDAYIEATIKEDRANMLDRIQYLQDQRDKYVDDAIEELRIR